MKGIAQILANQYQVTVLDWLGFGESECPPVDYNPVLFQQLLQDFVAAVFNSPIILIVAGHASGYALKLAKDVPDIVSKLILIAPTCQGLDWQRAKWGKQSSRIILLGEKIGVKCADEVIVVSKALKSYFSQTYGIKPLYIPNGPGKYADSNPNFSYVKSLGLEPGKYYSGIIPKYVSCL